jgi:hypothetical protein
MKSNILLHLFQTVAGINPGANPDVGCIDGQATVAYQTVYHP